jgi:DNA-nicking Smr family endonuclease
MRGRRGRTLGPDEAKLWAAAMKDTRPLAGRSLPEVAEMPEVTAGGAPASAATPAKAPYIDQVRPVELTPPPLEKRARPAVSIAERGLDATRLDTVDGSTADKLRRGRMPIEARLDLHGLTQDAAWRELEGFLARAEAAGRRSLLIITGTGLRSRLRNDDDDLPFRLDERRPGVLRDSLPRWLSAPHNRPRVLAWSPAQQRDGGAGAFYVLLRRRR